MTVLALHDEGDIRPTAGSSCCGLFPVVCPLPLLAAQEALGHVPGKFVSQFEQGRLLACSLSVRKVLKLKIFQIVTCPEVTFFGEWKNKFSSKCNL